MKTNFLFVLLISLFACACNDNSPDINDIIIPSDCAYIVISNAEAYENAPNDEFSLNQVTLLEDCLTFTFSASGCSGDTWEVKLIDAENIIESNPPQRNIRLSLKNIEECEAYITKEISFDVSNLSVDGNQVLLNITNANESILYEY